MTHDAETVERVAKAIFPAMKWVVQQFPGGDVELPEWVEGGNSLVQDECRRSAMAALEAMEPREPTIAEAAKVILSNRWGGYGNTAAMNAMFRFVHDEHGRHMLPVSHYDGVFQAALSALTKETTP